MPTPRVASLLPSATEIVCALGLEDSLVGVSHECDFPPGVGSRPILTRARVASAGPSAAIDRDVRRLLEGALAVYELEIDELTRLAPDVIVTQDLCDVCAVSFADVERAAREVLGPDTRIVNLRPSRLDDVRADFARVGEALGRKAAAREMRAAFDARVGAVAERAEGLAARPRVLTIEWLEPVMIGGTWMPELVTLAGGEPLVTRPGEHAPTLDAAALRELEPEVVLVKPCGYALERTRAELDGLRATLAGTGWHARVYMADGNAFFNRPGPRLADSLEILAACVHPEEFADMTRRHAGSFERLEDGA